MPNAASECNSQREPENLPAITAPKQLNALKWHEIAEATAQ
jgi:hypothetical protein